MQKLSESQKGFLRGLKERGSWSPGCEWYYGSQKLTLRIAKRMVVLGLVENQRYDVGIGLVWRYILTKTGLGMLQDPTEVPVEPTETADRWHQRFAKLEQILLHSLKCEFMGAECCSYGAAYGKGPLPRLFRAIPKKRPEKGRVWRDDWMCEGCIKHYGYKVVGDPIGDAERFAG